MKNKILDENLLDLNEDLNLNLTKFLFSPFSNLELFKETTRHFFQKQLFNENIIDLIDIDLDCHRDKFKDVSELKSFFDNNITWSKTCDFYSYLELKEKQVLVDKVQVVNYFYSLFVDYNDLFEESFKILNSNICKGIQYVSLNFVLTSLFDKAISKACLMKDETFLEKFIIDFIQCCIKNNLNQGFCFIYDLFNSHNLVLDKIKDEIFNNQSNSIKNKGTKLKLKELETIFNEISNVFNISYFKKIFNCFVSNLSKSKSNNKIQAVFDFEKNLKENFQDFYFKAEVLNQIFIILTEQESFNAFLDKFILQIHKKATSENKATICLGFATDKKVVLYNHCLKLVINNFDEKVENEFKEKIKNLSLFSLDEKEIIKDFKLEHILDLYLEWKCKINEISII